MARRSGGSHKGVEEKRRSLPIYQHYTLSPGKTKSHHPEAKCNHCLKEFVCGSKQRLIRHLRKCNSITNSDQIIAETLNTLARNSATGQLNHSILEASNLLPTQMPNVHRHETHQQQQQFIGQHQQSSSPTVTQALVVVGTTTQTTASANINNNNYNNYNNANISTTANNSIISNNSNHNASGIETGLIATTSNGPQQSSVLPIKRSKRGRPRKNPLSGPAIHVTTGVDGKTHFTPASQLPSNVQGNVATSNNPVGRQLTYSYHSTTAPTTQNHVVTPGAHLSTNPAHLASTHQTSPFKLNPEPIDKAYLKLVLTRNLPLSLCDTKEFQQWIKTFANDYKPPSSINLIAQNLKNEAQAARHRISNIIVKAPKKTINLELHNWPDESRGHLWYAIIANLDQKRFLVSLKDLSAQHLSNSPQHSTHQDLDEAAYDKLLEEFIEDCIKRVGSDRINSLLFTKQSIMKLDKSSARLRDILHSTHPSIITYYSWWDFTNQQTCNTSSLLSDYMHRFITYGKTLFEDLNQNYDGQRYQLISNYLNKFSSSIADFKLLFAAYLLNPKYKCAYMTQKAKEAARVEILNIASEFMPDESDGKTIFKQWELYLVREEPYDMIFEENRSALEWWMSLPCAESIRRVALRILRLKAFATLKRESLFSQLYLYEDETRSTLPIHSFEDAAIMRYFYDFEDKIGQNTTHTTSSNHTISANNNATNSFALNGYHDRTQAGNSHNQTPCQSNDSMRYLSSGSLETLATEANGRQTDSTTTISEGRQSFLDSFSDVVVESGYINHDHNHGDHLPSQHVESLPGYSLFMEYVNFEERGVEIVEEQTEKKRRKWTAQEILSKCQTNNNNNNNNNEIRSSK